MKKLLFAALGLVTLFSNACTKDPVSENGTLIMVRFQNSTDSDLEEAQMEFDSVNTTDVGAIPAGETTNYMVFDYFQTGYYPGGDYQFPTGSLNGKKDGVAFHAWSLNWCGTGVEYKQLDPGKYTIEIIKVGNDSPWTYQIKFVD
ncbi:MAG: hypothetical protein Q7T20_15530 [Saprospiraceae bacterium]|nr:hypothetical protein [Saprospiraceae bacterium]